MACKRTEFDALFERMKGMDNGPERQGPIDRALEIVRRDAPWVWGYYPKAFSLRHAWLKSLKPNLMADNTLKYRRVDPQERERRREEWNRPIVWPLWLTGAVAVAAAVPAARAMRRRERGKAL